MFQDFLNLLTDPNGRCVGVLITGDYPAGWANQELQNSLQGKFAVMIDAFSNPIADTVDIVLPGATWTEKAGTFLSARNHLQSFEQAISPVGQARSEGQVATDLAAACGHSSASTFDANATRQQMGEIFVSEVRHPDKMRSSDAEMRFIEI